jgi:hypothetical protein
VSSADEAGEDAREETLELDDCADIVLDEVGGFGKHQHLVLTVSPFQPRDSSHDVISHGDDISRHHHAIS